MVILMVAVNIRSSCKRDSFFSVIGDLIEKVQKYGWEIFEKRRQESLQSIFLIHRILSESGKKVINYFRANQRQRIDVGKLPADLLRRFLVHIKLPKEVCGSVIEKYKWSVNFIGARIIFLGKNCFYLSCNCHNCNLIAAIHPLFSITLSIKQQI